jgi:hypothetical protein
LYINHMKSTIRQTVEANVKANGPTGKRTLS